MQNGHTFHLHLEKLHDKVSIFFIFFVILFVGISLYQIKHFITKKEIELTQIQNNIKSAQSNINILKAELSYLKRPDRIEKIALNKLGLREIFQQIFGI